MTVVILAITLSGCTLIGLEHDDPPAPANHTGEWDAVLIVDGAVDLAGPAITVEDALDHVGGELVVVRGVLFVDDFYEAVWLCTDAVQPQPSCDGTTLRIVSADAEFDPTAVLDAASHADLQTSYRGLRWSADATLVGRIVEAATDPQ